MCAAMTSLGASVDVDGDIPGHLLSTAHQEVGGIPFDHPAVPWKSQHLFTLIKSNKFPASLSGTTGENNKSSLFPYEVSPFCRCHKTTHQCDQNCENHQLYMLDLTFAPSSSSLTSCFPRECTKGHCLTLRPGEEYCQNTVIQRREYPSIEIFSTKFCGFGLFAMEAIPKHTLIEEYLGEVITEEECHSRMAKYSTNDCFYFAALENGYVLDASRYGSLARYANHHCNPNCMLQKWIVNGAPRIVLQALKNIQIGEELTYNYNYCNDGMDEMISLSQRQKCSCGYQYCSGTIGGKVVLPTMTPAMKWQEKARHLLSDLQQFSPQRNEEDLSGGATPDPGAIGPHQSNKGRCKVKKILEMIQSAQDLDEEDSDATAAVATSSLSLINTIEYQQLRDLSSQYTSWKSQFDEIFMIPILKLSPTHLIPQDVFTSLLSSAPPGVYCDESDQKIKKLQKLLIKSENIPKNSSESSSETPERYEWKKYLAWIDIITQLLPMRCPPAESLLVWYEQYSQWCHNSFSLLFFLRNDGDNCLLTHQQSKILKGSSLWTDLTILSKLYEVKITPWGLLTQHFLGDLLQQYERRQSNLSLLRQDPSTTSLQVHCFCQLEENWGEYSQLIECDLCKQWYHPQCAHYSGMIKNKSKSLQFQETNEYLCPLCQCNVSAPNAFLFGDTDEWYQACRHVDLGYSPPLPLSSSQESLPEKVYFLFELTFLNALQKESSLTLRQTPVFEMMEQIQDYLTVWYQEYHQLEQKFLNNSSSSLVDAQIMIDNSQLNELLRDLMRHYCHFRLLRVCPTASVWIRVMIWKLCCDQFCSQLPPYLPFSSDVSIYDRKFKKLISFDELKKIFRAGKYLVVQCQTHLQLTSPPKDLLSGVKRPCPPLAVQVNLRSLNEHINKIQHALKESTDCRDHERLVQYAKEFIEYHHLIDFSAEYGYIKSLCCYQNHMKTNVRTIRTITETGAEIEVIGKTEEGAIEPWQEQGQGQESYCYCQNPENDKYEMVCCERCQSWYHCQCVGIVKKKHLKALESESHEYICLSCAVKLNQEYYYLQPKKPTQKRKTEAIDSTQAILRKKITTGAEAIAAPTQPKFPKIEGEAEPSV